jgi:hypothetical protein
MQAPIDYLNPQLPPDLALVRMPFVPATPASLAGFGRLVDDAKQCAVEIVRWPAQGRRPVDADTGDQGGTTAGVFVSEWQGDILRPQRGGGRPLPPRLWLSAAACPHRPRADAAPHAAVACQLPSGWRPAVFPLGRRPFYVPLALPGDEVTSQNFVCFRGACTRVGGLRASSAACSKRWSSPVLPRSHSPTRTIRAAPVGGRKPFR